MTIDEKRAAMESTLLDMLEPEEAEVALAEMSESSKKKKRSFSYSENPDYVLRPSRRNPRVRRWMRKGEGDEQAEATTDGSSGDETANDDGARDARKNDFASKHPDFVEAFELESLVRDGTKHQEVLDYWDNLEIVVAKRGAAKTPIYYPDSHEVVLSSDHLSPSYWKKFGVRGPGIILAHEFAHAWDFARAEADGHKGKSYWASNVMPRIIKATNGRPPSWFFGLPEYRRMAYAAGEVVEMPAVLTEMALSDPESYQAMSMWFEKNHGLDLRREMEEFWGVDLLDGVYVDEAAVNERLRRMERHSRPRGLARLLRRPAKWRSKMVRKVSYMAVHPTWGVWGNQDPGFIPLRKLMSMTEPLVSKERENG